MHGEYSTDENWSTSLDQFLKLKKQSLTRIQFGADIHFNHIDGHGRRVGESDQAFTTVTYM